MSGESDVRLLTMGERRMYWWTKACGGTDVAGVSCLLSSILFVLGTLGPKLLHVQPDPTTLIAPPGLRVCLWAKDVGHPWRRLWDSGHRSSNFPGVQHESARGRTDEQR